MAAEGKRFSPAALAAARANLEVYHQSIHQLSFLDVSRYSEAELEQKRQDLIDDNTLLARWGRQRIEKGEDRRRWGVARVLPVEDHTQLAQLKTRAVRLFKTSTRGGKTGMYAVCASVGVCVRVYPHTCRVHV